QLSVADRSARSEGIDGSQAHTGGCRIKRRETTLIVGVHRVRLAAIRGIQSTLAGVRADCMPSSKECQASAPWVRPLVFGLWSLAFGLSLRSVTKDHVRRS